MAKFDIISAAGRAYQTSWSERRYLLRLAAFPFLIKLACIMLAGVLASEENFLRFYLIMVPAYLAEGWMLSHYVRFLTLGQRWPFRPTGDADADMEQFAGRLRGVLSGMIVYALINMAIGLFTVVATYYLAPYMPSAPNEKIAQVPPGVALFSLLSIVFLFWGIRLLWLYVPFAMNFGAKGYLHILRGLNTSVYMIGLWLACLLPFFILLQLAVSLFAAPAEAAFGTGAGDFVILLLGVVTATLKGIVVTAGVTYALTEIYAGKNS